MRIIVTGATGFIGHYLLKKLNVSHELTILSRNENLAEEIANTEISCYSYDFIRESEKLVESYDAIIHLASQRPIKGKVDSYLDYKQNLDLVSELLVFAVRNSIDKFINISTKAVYGMSRGVLKEDNYLAPTSYYGLSKQQTEEMCNFYANNFGINCINLRLAQVIGYGELQQNIVTTFINNATKKKEQVLWGQGVGNRAYVYVKDVVVAIEQALSKDKVSGSFNIAMKDSVSHRQAAEVINMVFNNQGIRFLKDKPEDESKEKIDSSKARKLLNWRPHFDNFLDAIDDMKDEMKKENNNDSI
jgi:UDP-glucose 4-epimerase